jgi:hypothetical protein
MGSLFGSHTQVIKKWGNEEDEKKKKRIRKL